MNLLPEPMLASPCVGTCRLDSATGWCLGCARTGDELERWMAMDGPARAAVWKDLPRRKARWQVGFDLLSWAPTTALSRLAELSARPGATWRLGVHGATAELTAAPGHTLASTLADGALTLRTAGGGMRLRGHPGLRVFALPDRLVLTLHRSRLEPAPACLVELGPDRDALDPAGLGQPLFDLGLGRPTIRFAVRTGAAGIVRALRAGVGRPLDQAVASLLAAAAPTRVVLCPLGRIEVDVPMSENAGPRTRLSPAMLALGGELEPGLELPEGYAPLFSLSGVPASTIRR
jgi:predicted Fe-S protein YdhL (DUF1289 family)